MVSDIMVLNVGVRTGSENGTAVLTGFSIKTAVKNRFLRFLGIYLIKLENNRYYS